MSSVSDATLVSELPDHAPCGTPILYVVGDDPTDEPLWKRDLSKVVTSPLTSESTDLDELVEEPRFCPLLARQEGASAASAAGSAASRAGSAGGHLCKVNEAATLKNVLKKALQSVRAIDGECNAIEYPDGIHVYYTGSSTVPVAQKSRVVGG